MLFSKLQLNTGDRRGKISHHSSWFTSNVWTLRRTDFKAISDIFGRKKVVLLQKERQRERKSEGGRVRERDRERDLLNSALQH